MYTFNNDYNNIADERILKALMKYNNKSYEVYGLDKISEKAKELIKNKINSKKTDIYFVIGGTLANKVSISHFLKSYEAIICSSEAHIATHETGAIEDTGHRLLEINHKEGKILPEDIEKICQKNYGFHMVKPRLVYISNSTEYGTTYSKKELEEIYKVCKKNELYLYIDGARLANAMLSENLNFDDIAKYSDAFTIGIAKNGALFGEAIVICNDDLKPYFSYNLKQKGAVYSKGYVLGIQFYEMFKDDLFFKLAKNANDLAKKIKDKLIEKNVNMYINSNTNMIFPIFTNDKIKEFEKEFIFEPWEEYDENSKVMRIVTSFASKKEVVELLCKKIDEIFKEN